MNRESLATSIPTTTNMVINLSEQHSLITNWIAELRDEDIQKDRMRFRRNLERIGEVAAYEISKTLPFEGKRNTDTAWNCSIEIIDESAGVGDHSSCRPSIASWPP